MSTPPAAAESTRTAVLWKQFAAPLRSFVAKRATAYILVLGAANGMMTLERATVLVERYGSATFGSHQGHLAAATGTARATSPTRAAAERLDIEFKDGDAEALPLGDAAFDVVLSTFGVMFAANQQQAARELLRVCRPGGRIGLANWTPEGFVGQLFKAVAAHVPPPPVPSPLLWGTEAGLAKLFGDVADSIRVERRQFTFRYTTPEHWLDVFRTYYGPMLKAFGALDALGQKLIREDLLALARRFNRATDGTLVAPSEYLEIVVTRR